MQKRPLFWRWIGAGSCEDFGRKHGFQGGSRQVAARIDGDRPVPVLRPARNRLQCLAPTARSAGDIGPFGSLAISLFNDRETDIAGRSEEHTSELQSLMRSSYAVFCLKKKNTAVESCSMYT